MARRIGFGAETARRRLAGPRRIGLADRRAPSPERGATSRRMTLGGAEPEAGVAPKRSVAGGPERRAAQPASSAPTQSVAGAARAVGAVVLFGLATLFLLGAVLFFIGTLNEGGDSASFGLTATVIAAYSWFSALQGMTRSLGGAPR